MAVADGEAALLQFMEGIAETGIVDAQALSQSGSGDRGGGLLESGEDHVGQRQRGGGGAVETQGQRLLAAADKAQQNGLGSGGGAMLDGEQQAVVGAAGEIAGGVGPGVQVRGAAQGLTEVAAAAFGHVVDEDDSQLMAAVEFAQKAQQSGDVGGAVFVEAVQPDQRIEQQQSGAQGAEGVVEGVLIAVAVEAQAGSGNHVQVEGSQVEAAVAAQLRHPIAHPRQRILCEVDQRRTWSEHLEPVESRGGGRDRDRQIEAEPRFAAFGRAPDDADGGGAPQVADQPLRCAGLRIDGMYRDGGQAVHDSNRGRTRMEAIRLNVG